MRHHHSIEGMLLYYPQDTTEDLGPTVLLPYTPYWEDGPKPPAEGMAEATGEEKDESEYTSNLPLCFWAYSDRLLVVPVFSSAHAKLGWPVESSPYKVVVPAGSVAIVHFDIYHRGSRRLESADDAGRKRAMYKFWLSRTADPTEPSWDHSPAADDDSPTAFGKQSTVAGPLWAYFETDCSWPQRTGLGDSTRCGRMPGTTCGGSLRVSAPLEFPTAFPTG